jgi:hypothetical protein
MEIDGWLKKLYFLLSKDRLVNIYISATKFQNIVKEMVMKVSLYNLFRRMA